MSHKLRGLKEEAMDHLIKNDRLARFGKRAGVPGAIIDKIEKLNVVEDPTVRPSKHFIFHEENPTDPNPPAAQDGDRNVTNLIRSQDYQKLSKGLSPGVLFEDTHFDKTVNQSVEWLRPRDISKDPKFVVAGHDRFDVNQGELGNCWFLSALANLAGSKRYFDRVVPPDQAFDEDSYRGIFRFRFFRFNSNNSNFFAHFNRFNSWVEVVVDDLLPTRRGKLIFLSSGKRETNEFWGPLLEKAYAKLYGSYKVRVSE